MRAAVQPETPEPAPGPRSAASPAKIAPRGMPVSRMPSGPAIQAGSAIEYWRLLRRRRGLLALFASAGILAGILAFLFQPPVYQARGSLEIQDINPEFLNMKQVSPVGSSSPAGDITDIQTQVKVLKSESLINNVLNKLGVFSVAGLDPQNVNAGPWRRALSLPRSLFDGGRPLTETAARRLQVDVAGQTRIIEIKFQSTDPKLSARFVNVLASEFIEQNLQARLQLGQRTSVWLSQQLGELRAKLQSSDDALQTYASHNRLIYTGDKENISQEKLRQLQAEASKAHADRILKESRFELARTAPADSLPDVVNDGNLRALQTALSDLRRQEAEIAITFKPEYTKVRRIRAEIATVESAIASEREAIVSRIVNDFREAGSREAMLSGDYDNQVRQVLQDSDKSIQYNILKRDVDTNRQIYEAMLQRVKESGIASALRASNVRVVDSARLPEEPFRPSLPFNGAAGLLCGLMLGGAVAVSRERRDQSVREPGETARLFGVPELGVIPRALSLSGGRTSLVNTLLSKSHLRQLAGSQPETPRVGALQAAPDGMADSFRALLASILLSRAKERPHVLVISSAGPSEGKTTVAINLAAALARTEQRILLIDGDLRKPRVHEALGLRNTTGVTDLLEQRQFDRIAADDAIRTAGVPNLRVLTSGRPLQSGCDLLFSKAMPGLIRHYSKEFDMIIIDTPPLLRIPDARILGRMADAVVLVIRAERTMPDAIGAALGRLNQDNTPVLGIILNDWNPRSSPGGYYGNYADSELRKYTTS